MCEGTRIAMTPRGRLGRTLVAISLLTAFASGASRAQDLTHLGARVLSADNAVAASHDSVNFLIDEMKKIVIPRDSMRIGGLTLRFTAKDLSNSTIATLQRAMNDSWLLLQRGLGDAATVVSQREPIIVRQHQVMGYLTPDVLSFEVAGHPGASRAFRVPISADEARTGILETVGSLAAMGESSSLEAYTGPWIPAAGISAESWGEAAIDLATATSSATRDCFAGSVKRCESALGLTVVKDPLTEWYSAPDWRVMVARQGLFPREAPERKALREQCLAGDAPEVCEMLARERPVWQPLNGDTRRTLIGLALELGGPKAYDRLTGTRGSALEVLAATSGLGADSLVSAWRQRVLAATPPRVAPHVLEVGAMLAWTVVFAAVSTRKRP